jgi:hypothetical protein
MFRASMVNHQGLQVYKTIAAQLRTLLVDK